MLALASRLIFIALISYSGITTANVIYFYEFNSDNDTLTGYIEIHDKLENQATDFNDEYVDLYAVSTLYGNVSDTFNNFVFNGFDLTDDSINLATQAGLSPYPDFNLFGTFYNGSEESLLKHLNDNDILSLSYFSTAAQSVPEPSSLTLLGLGLVGFGFSRKKKKA